MNFSSATEQKADDNEECPREAEHDRRPRSGHRGRAGPRGAAKVALTGARTNRRNEGPIRDSQLDRSFAACAWRVLSPARNECRSATQVLREPLLCRRSGLVLLCVA